MSAAYCGDHPDDPLREVAHQVVEGQDQRVYYDCPACRERRARLTVQRDALLATLKMFCDTPVERVTGMDWSRANALVSRISDAR